MTPSAEELRLPHNAPPPARPDAPVQLFQGCYYLVVGLWAAIGLSTWQSPAAPVVGLRYEWGVRLIAAIAAAVGLGLIIASRRRAPVFLATWVGVIATIVLAVVDIVGLSLKVLPYTFLIDMVLEVVFFIWWMFALASRRNSVDVAAHPLTNLRTPA